MERIVCSRFSTTATCRVCGYVFKELHGTVTYLDMVQVPLDTVQGTPWKPNDVANDVTHVFTLTETVSEG